MSCFPMKGHKANWLMLASGMGATAEWKVYIYNRIEKPRREKRQKSDKGQDESNEEPQQEEDGNNEEPQQEEDVNNEEDKSNDEPQIQEEEFK